MRMQEGEDRARRDEDSSSVSRDRESARSCHVVSCRVVSCRVVVCCVFLGGRGPARASRALSVRGALHPARVVLLADPPRPTRRREVDSLVDECGSCSLRRRRGGGLGMTVVGVVYPYVQSCVCVANWDHTRLIHACIYACACVQSYAV